MRLHKMMEMDQCKLFIGGISWDTDEDRLREYFGKYGEVVEAVTMRDRNTGRARGFGFVVFSDPKVAERVVKDKHEIDGRTVEAKKAVPRDDQHLINRNSVSVQGSPGPVRTKKIFVGGLASTVTETDFKNYFDQFGTIKDVVVMYDPNTQRPRGFGFITFDSEDSVDRVLHKVFHELNGKMVEVKRAVPKELSPGPSRSPFIGYNYGFGRTSNFLSNHGQGYNLGSLGGYGMRIDARYNPLTSDRSAFSQFGSPAYGMGLNVEQGLNPGYVGGPSFSGYSRVLSPYFGGGNNQSRYSTPIAYNTSVNPSDSFFDSSSSSPLPSRNVWANGGLNTSTHNTSSGSYLDSGTGGGGFGVFGNNGVNWVASLGSNNDANYTGGNSNNYRAGENTYALGGYARNNGTKAATTSSFPAPTGDYEKLYLGGSVYGDYGDPTWQTTSSELESPGSFGYGLGRSEDVSAKESDDYGMGYDMTNRRQSGRGIAS